MAVNAAIAGTSVPEKIISVVFNTLQQIDPTITCAIGQRASEDNADKRRVVAIPLGASAIDSTTIKPGGVWGDDGGRQLMIRHFDVEWHCHDGPTSPGAFPDFTNSEALFLNTLIAIRLAKDDNGNPFHNGVKFGGEEWIDQQSGADGFARAGHVVKFVSTFDLPVYETPPTLVPLTASPNIVTTVTMNDDDEESEIINEG